MAKSKEEKQQERVEQQTQDTQLAEIQEKGFYGEKVDERDNAEYTVAGVTKSS